METIDFEPLAEDHLTLLHEWLNMSHVSQWYEIKDKTLSGVRQKYLPRILGVEPTHCFLISIEGTPAGLIQWYFLRDYPDYAQYLKTEDSAVSIDLFIGNSNFVHRGFGSRIIHDFLQKIVFTHEEVPACYIGPSVSNLVAIRVGQRAGFKPVQTVQILGEKGPEQIMRLSRGNLV